MKTKSVITILIALALILTLVPIANAGRGCSAPDLSAWWPDLTVDDKAHGKRYLVSLKVVYSWPEPGIEGDYPVDMFYTFHVQSVKDRNSSANDEGVFTFSGVLYDIDYRNNYDLEKVTLLRFIQQTIVPYLYWVENYPLTCTPNSNCPQAVLTFVERISEDNTLNNVGVYHFAMDFEMAIDY